MSTPSRSPRLMASSRSSKLSTPPRSPRMPTPPRSPGRRPPMPVMAPSTHSLTGMERVVPPNRPAVSRSTGSSQSDVNKPLPPAPLARRPSSSYSTDSGYTHIVASYDSDDELILEATAPPVPLIPPLHQPSAYRETISALLSRRLHDLPSPRSSVPSIPSIQKQSPVISPALSTDEDRFAASFGDLSIRSHSSESEKVSPLSSPRPPEMHPVSSSHPLKLQKVTYTSDNPSISLSPRLPPGDNTIDQTIVPRPLSVRRSENSGSSDSRLPRTFQDAPHSAPPIPRPSSPEEPYRSHFSSASSDSSSKYVIHTGIANSVRAYMRHKRHEKKLAKQKEQQRRILSAMSAKYPSLEQRHSEEQRKRQGSWVSQRRASVQSIAYDVADRMRRFSAGNTTNAASPTEGSQTKKRRGSKQRAVPRSPYQKYGVAIWEAPKKQKKGKIHKKTQSAPDVEMSKTRPSKHKREPSESLIEVARAFQSGQRGVVEAIGVDSGNKEKKKKKRLTAEEKRREALKSSIVVVGPAELTSVGVTNWI